MLWPDKNESEDEAVANEVTGDDRRHSNSTLIAQIKATANIHSLTGPNEWYVQDLGIKSVTLIKSS